MVLLFPSLIKENQALYQWYTPPVLGSTRLPCARSIRTVSGASRITKNNKRQSGQYSAHFQ